MDQDSNKKFKQNKIFTSNFRVFANIFYKISNIINNQKLTDAHTCYKQSNYLKA